MTEPTTNGGREPDSDAEIPEPPAYTAAVERKFSRRVLIPRRDDDPTLIADRLAQGRGPDFIRLDATPAERLAQRPPQPKRFTVQIPPKVVAVARIVAGLSVAALPALAAFPQLPNWLLWATYFVAIVACFAGGVTIPSPNILANRSPITSLTAISAIASGGGILGTVAVGLPEGVLKNALLAISALLFALAGVATPTPKAEEAK